MRLPLILIALVLGGATPAVAEPAHREPQPFSGEPPWRAQAAVGGGVVMVNSAGGQHYITPELTLQAALRTSPYLTFRSRYDAAYRKDGTPRIYAENTWHWLSFRPEGTFGTDRAQFVFGLGPSLIVTTTRLHGPGRNVHANSLRLGFEYGVGLRWMIGRVPMGMDFGGQQRQTRHDFRATFVVGIPVIRSRAGGEPGKEAIR